MPYYIQKMQATAFIYELKKTKGKSKTYLIRNIFGYTDISNHGKYTYQRTGKITPYINEKWGKSVIITKRTDKKKVTKILTQQKIKHKTRDIELND